MADQTLAQTVKAKYPGVYDDIPDAQLEAQVKAKYPGVYDDLPTTKADFSTTNQKGPDGNAVVESPIIRAAREFYNKSPLAAGVAGVEGIAHVIAHPLDTYFGAAPIAETVKGLARAQWDQAVQAAQKAKDAYNGDKLSAVEAVGHGLAAALPILGPAAADAGEHGARGDVAGAVGGALGLLTPFAVKWGLDLARAPNAAKADLLHRDATQQVAQQVLAPGNPSYKPAAARLAPQVLERGLQGSRLELQQIAEEGKADALARIDAAANIDPKAPVDLKPVVQSLNDEIDRLQPTGVTPPGLDKRIAALKTQRDFLIAEGQKETGSPSRLTLPFEQVRGLRQVLDQQALEGQVYASRDPMHPAAAAGRAAADAAGALRSAIAQNRPELAVPNADYTFHKTLSDILDPTIGRPKQTNYVPSGITGGMVTAGAVIGETLSDVPGLKTAGALVGAFGLPKLKALLASPQWQLASAAKKYELADALRAGKPAIAQGILLKIASAAPRTLTGDVPAGNSPTQTTP